MGNDYLKRFYAGDVLALSRLMSLVERGGTEAEALLNELYPRSGRAYRVGVTGPGGAGKSTLIAALTERYRKMGNTIGVIAEDPSSPYTGGAVLGDRVRMLDAASDEGVFIRSVASRGAETGFSAVAMELADVLDAFGRDIIFLETLGVGQQEYRIRFSSYTTVVVFTPESGDEVQSLKSGLIEIGDIFVVNKADRPDAQRFAADLSSILDLRSGAAEVPRVLTTDALAGDGVDALVEAIQAHRAYLAKDGRFEARHAEVLRQRTRLVAEEKLKSFFWQNSYIQSKLDMILGEVVAGRKSPYEAAAEVLANVEIKSTGKDP